MCMLDKAMALVRNVGHLPVARQSLQEPLLRILLFLELLLRLRCPATQSTG